MGKILIIKTGETFPDLRAKKGDFEDWTLRGLGIDRQHVTIVPVYAGVPLPGPAGHAGIVITGSHAFVTQHADWSERTAEWLTRAVERGIPILGICYGHQLLAYALGGQVGDNPNGREFGTVEVQFNGHTHDDALFGGFAKIIQAHVCHTQSVLRLPAGAQLLASSAMDPHAAFRIGDAAWGVQFHPEFDAEAVRVYIRRLRSALLAEGQDPDALMATCAETPASHQLLRQFAAIAAAS
jgi:GMP synthase (glutamine-hydrolysing)